MPREKQNYRDMLLFLSEKYPPTMTRGQACEALGVSRPTLRTMIGKNHIKVQDGKIPIGSVASYLCG